MGVKGRLQYVHRQRLQNSVVEICTVETHKEKELAGKRKNKFILYIFLLKNLLNSVLASESRKNLFSC